MGKKIAYDMGIYYSSNIIPEFDYKNIKVYGVGINILFEFFNTREKKRFYFMADECEKIHGELPGKLLLDEIYIEDLICLQADPSEKFGVSMEPRFPEMLEVFKQGFSISYGAESFFIDGTFLPEEECPVLCSFPITEEKFREIYLGHYTESFDPIGYYTKEVKHFT